jgi:Family of unknown function (DUF6173)
MAAKPETKTPPKPKSPADWAYDRLVLYIRDFERQLNADQEVAIGFAGSEAGIIRIEGLGFFDPDILTFYGTDDAGMKMQLVQHVSQLSVMLQARPKLDPDDAPRRIGFKLTAGWSGGESGDGSA